MEKFDSDFGELCVKKGYVSFTQLKECIDIQEKIVEMGLEAKPLSEVLVEKKLLTKEQVEEVLKDISKGVSSAADSAEGPAKSGPAIKNEYEFGELAIKEGLITFDQLKECLDIQNKIRNLGYEPKPLDEILIDRKFLTRHQVDALKQTGGKPKEAAAPRVESRLGEIAVKKKFITKEQLEECLLLQARSRDPGQTPKKLGEILVEKGYITAEQLDELLIQSAKAPAPFEIPGYEIISKIGLGGMGAVYKARQVSIGREVAIKVLFPKYTKDREYMERFLREARLLAKMSHPNIVLAIDAGQVRGVPFFVMEFIDGISVSELLEHKGKLPERDCLKIGMHVARALQHAFKHKLVHRDIKPQNVMITKDGLVKVCDLGIAKRTDVKDDLHLTSEGMAIGTPYYMSPEAALGREVDIRADIYSLGATLYHLATGIPPFDSSSPAAILAMHVNEPLLPPKKRFPGMSDPFNEMITKMMRKNPMERFQTPADAAQVMEDLLRHKPGIPTAPQPAAERPSEVIRERNTRRLHAEVAASGAKSSNLLFAILAFLGVAILFAAAYWFLSDMFGKSPTGHHNPPPPDHAGPTPNPPLDTPRPPDRPPIAGDSSPLQREHQSKIAEINAYKEQIAMAKPQDEFKLVYNAYMVNVTRFQGTEFYAFWVRERDAYVEAANLRADDLWTKEFKSKAEVSEQLGELKKAIEVLEKFPEALRYVGPNIPTRAETERRQLLAALQKKAGMTIDEYEGRARTALGEGNLVRAWELAQELSLIGGEAQALRLFPDILDKLYEQMITPPLTAVKVQQAIVQLDAMAKQVKTRDVRSLIDQRRGQIHSDFEKAVSAARQKFEEHHSSKLHSEFEAAMRGRDYTKIAKGIGTAFAASEYAPLLQTSEFDYATISKLALKAAPAADELRTLATSIEYALDREIVHREESVREVLLELWSSVLVRELMHQAAKGLVKLAAEKKETLGTLSHSFAQGGKDFRVKVSAQDGLSADIVKVSGSTEVGGAVFFYPKKSGSWVEGDIVKMASAARNGDASFDLRVGLLFAFSERSSDAAAYFRKATVPQAAIKSYLEKLKR